MSGVGKFGGVLGGDPFPWQARALCEYRDYNRLAIKRDRKSTRLNSSHSAKSRMPSSA